MDAFFSWCDAEAEKVLDEMPISNGIRRARNQREGLSRFIGDGRLPIHKNMSELALRREATGRKAWLFFGSGDHAQAAANIFSLVASCKLHDIDAESYLADVIRIMPFRISSSRRSTGSRPAPRRRGARQARRPRDGARGRVRGTAVVGTLRRHPRL